MADSLTPAQRSQRARLAAQTRWANVENTEAQMRPARDGFRAKLAREIDPDGTLPEVERIRRVDAAMKAHMTRMALKSSRVRGAKAKPEVAS